MKHVSLFVTVASACLLLISPGAHASDSPAPVATEAADVIEVYTDGDARAVLNARLVALAAVLELSPEQEKFWPPVENSIRKIAAQSIARGKQRANAAPPADVLDVLERVSDAELMRSQDLTGFVAAARPLAASLTEQQRNRLPAFLGIVSNPEGPLSTHSLWLFEEEER
ncbi:hypothetical protein [Kaistia terrae]|uniref:Uncharacterized protein n=1 Tax=Kaistia terrae TaxID=537017 RepID=A0ABW0Q3N3_9HYPH|nr:hypothetical protein [Kaistia terrae]MCX5581710.1 hypothetical protein [Kaistia terrae]